MPTVPDDNDFVSSNNDNDTSSNSSADSFEDIAESDDDELTDDDVQVEVDKGASSLSAAVVWTGWQKKTPVILFRADALVCPSDEVKRLGERFHLAFRMGKSDCKLVRSILVSHGFHEASVNGTDFNVMWTGSHVKPYVLRTFLEFQKINHFPRSYEVTRKDRLFKNVQRMQQLKGFRHFDFVPQSYVIPSEYQEFAIAACKDKGPWIVKPVALSRGRGIFLITSPEQLPLDDNVIVSRYISNPYLIDGFKFDVRLYVAVTSFDPLIIYLYEEGLTRFATVKFDKSCRTLRNQCMHLTNYSVNKKSSDYVQNDDADVEDFGNKWSLGALLRYLCSQGVDTTALMMSIEDVLIKTLISVELPVATACKMFMPYRGNCFELFGFDILIDDKLRPWVLEVNLSPSLACDAPLDLKIKSNMISDLFSLIGVVCHDPMTRKQPHDGSWNVRSRPAHRPQSARGRPKSSLLFRRRRPDSASFPSKSKSSVNGTSGSVGPSLMSLSSEEIRILRRTKEEYARRGGWVRIFPSVNSWEMYSQFLQYPTTYNSLLYSNLYGNRLKSENWNASGVSKAKSLNLHSAPNGQLAAGLQNNAILAQAVERCKQYQRKLACLGQKHKRRSRHSSGVTTATSRPAAAGTSPSKTAVVVQGRVEDIYAGDRDTDNDSELSEKLSATTPDTESMPESRKRLVQGNVTDAFNGKQDAKLNIVKLLEGGKTISKVQARLAFATYLTCIQHRLTNETYSHADAADNDNTSSNEQMDLVLKFLQRAASNLQNEFKVVAPSSRLPINSRRSLLASQLRDFIQIYNAETIQLKKKLRNAKPETGNEETLIDEDQFRMFVSSASENQLEEVLTVYTRLSRSASVFLRSGSVTSVTETVNDAEPMTTQKVRVKADREKENRDSAMDTATKTAKKEKHVGDDISGDSLSMLPSNVASRLAQQTSSYRGAVAAYSAKLTPTVSSTAVSGPRQRPKSAFAGISVGSRPVSSASKPNTSAFTSETRVATETRETEVTAALHQLALRQKRRQYSATLTGNVLTGTVRNRSVSRERLVKEDSSDDSGEDGPTVYETFSLSRGGAAVVERRESAAVGHNRTSSIERPGRHSADARVRGLPASDSADIVSGSGDTSRVRAIVSQQNLKYFDCQRSMIEQSRALLEQSKARHHALVAQAHTVQKRLRGRATTSSTSLYRPMEVSTTPTAEVPQSVITPKPPSAPHGERKPSYRTNRIARAVSVPHTEESYLSANVDSPNY